MFCAERLADINHQLSEKCDDWYLRPVSLGLALTNTNSKKKAQNHTFDLLYRVNWNQNKEGKISLGQENEEEGLIKSMYEWRVNY